MFHRCSLVCFLIYGTPFHILSLVCFLIYGVKVGPDMTEVRVCVFPLEINDGGGSRADYGTSFAMLNVFVEVLQTN